MEQALNSRKNIIITTVFAALALGTTAFILNWSEHSRNLANAGVFFVKLLPFVFALIGIAHFPSFKLRTVFRQVALLLLFFVAWCYFTPKLFYAFMEHPSDFNSYYLVIQMMMPYIILALAAAFRIGGGRTKDVLVFGGCGLLILVSGLEDLFSVLLRTMADPGYVFPEVWSWADHMSVFIGRALTKNEAYVFIGIHVALIAVVLWFAYAARSPFKASQKEGAPQ